MAVKDHAALIGLTRQALIDGLIIDVLILDVRAAYGRTDMQITPASGSGVKWVSANRLFARKGN